MRRVCRAFTVVELMMVICILLIVVTLFVPVVQSVRASGRLLSCKNNLSKLTEALFMYTTEWNDSLPTTRSDYTVPTNVGVYATDGNGANGLGVLCAGMFANGEALYCPSAEQRGGTLNRNECKRQWPGINQDPNSWLGPGGIPRNIATDYALGWRFPLGGNRPE